MINDGTTTASMASGTLADFALALRNKKIDDDIMVATADSLFYPDTVNVWGIVQVGASASPSAHLQPESQCLSSRQQLKIAHCCLRDCLCSILSKRRPILSRAITLNPVKTCLR